MTKFGATSAPLSLAASADKSLIRIKAGTNNPCKLVEFGAFFDGVNASDTPRRVKLVKQTTDGTGDSVTPVKITGTGSATVQASAVENFSAEPTDGDILWDGYVTPAGGRFVVQVPDDVSDIAGGERVAVRVVVPGGATTTNGIGYIHWTE